MIKLFGITIESPERLRYLRNALGVEGCQWCAKATTTELYRCAFPLLDNAEMVRNIKNFMASGVFSKPPKPVRVIYKNYCNEYGCTLPYDEPKSCEETTMAENIETKPMASSELSGLKEVLLQELRDLRNASNYTNADGSIDPQKAELHFKRAEAVNNIAGSLTAIHQEEINAKRLQLDAVKTALTNGYDVKVNGNLLGVEFHEHSR